MEWYYWWREYYRKLREKLGSRPLITVTLSVAVAIGVALAGSPLKAYYLHRIRQERD